MRKTTFQRATTRRILEAAPNLKYIAFYHGSEDRLNACMRDYADRSFVYVLTALHEGREYFLYAGKSRAQYSRHLTHTKKYEYDNIYLFECEPEFLSESETAVIRELTPLFNRASNPNAERIKLLLGIDYDAQQNSEKIRHYLELYSRYENVGLFGFALPVAVFAALEEEATATGCSCSEMLLRILEKSLDKKIAGKLEERISMETNLISAKEYGFLHNRSVEQVKQYLHQKNRLPGALRVGRDWVIARDAQFPEDHRGKRKE